MKCESGWGSFLESEVKVMVDWLLRIVYEESLASAIGRACLKEIGYKSRWSSSSRRIIKLSSSIALCMLELHR